MCSADIFLGVLAIFFPPLPVWVKRGLCSADSLINILLCALGFVPGLLHAWYIIAKFPEQDVCYYCHDDDGEDGRTAPLCRNTRRGGPGRVAYVHVPPPQRCGGGGVHYGATGGRGGHHGQQQQPSKQQQQGVVGGGAGPSDGQVPPSYAAAVAGDHKIQSNE